MPPKTPPTEAESAEASMLPKALLCHRTVGRFRVRVPEKRKDEAYFSTVKQVLEQHEAVHEVRIAPVTASVLVIHGGQCAQLLDHAENAGLFRSAEERRPSPTVVQWLDRLDRFDSEFLFARMAQHPQRAATGLFMLAVLQVVRGSIIPSAPSLLGEAMRLLREAEREAHRDPSSDDDL
ncbi:MAG: hypothetical protein PVH21_10770 [Myxococcales bacterium]|jgi:hypothetical protein